MAVYNALRDKLLKMYEDVFKENLSPSDRIDAPPVEIPLVPIAEEVPVYNAKVPIPEMSEYFFQDRIRIYSFC